MHPLQRKRNGGGCYLWVSKGMKKLFQSVSTNLHSFHQLKSAPYNLRATFRSEILDATTQAADVEQNAKESLANKGTQAESYHESMKRQQRRLYSWPSREVDEFEEDGGTGMDMLLHRMKALESTAALSLTTLTSLLIEFVARLDHLVEAVDELAKMAKFKTECVD